jgi:hypothetical protein
MSKKIKIFNIACISATVILIVISHIIYGITFLGILSDISTVFGVIYNALLITNEKKALHFGVINNLFLGTACFLQQVWLTAFYSILYSVPSLIIGIIKQRNVKNKEDLIIKKLSGKQALMSIGAYVVATGLFALALYFLKGNYWYLDAPINAGLLVSLFLLTHSYYHTYHYFMLSCTIALVMYTLLTLDDVSNFSFLILWGIYFIGNFVGLSCWINKYKRQQAQKKVAESSTENLEMSLS